MATLIPLDSNERPSDPGSDRNRQDANPIPPFYLDNLNPELLACMSATDCGRLVFNRVPMDHIQGWLERCPPLLKNLLRDEYDSVTQRFMLKCSPVLLHESFSVFFISNVITELVRKLGQRFLEEILEVGAGLTFDAFSGGYEGSQKLPDAYLRVVGQLNPRVVIESGWQSQMPDLQKDARMWLCGTSDVTKVAIIVCFEQGKLGTVVGMVKKQDNGTENAGRMQNELAHNRDIDKEFEDSRTAITADLVGCPNQSGAVGNINDNFQTISSRGVLSLGATDTTEAGLIASITRETQFSDLVDTLLHLNTAGELTMPLMGPITATLYLFRANSDSSSIYNFYTTPILPPGASGFGMSFGDLLSPEVSIEHGLDPQHGLRFDMNELQNVIEAEIPMMLMNSARRRANEFMNHYEMQETSGDSPDIITGEGLEEIL